MVNFERGYIILNSKYLDLLVQKYDCEEKVVTEIINLEAILNLPKGTEHFVRDLHGEYQAFQHVLRNGSGNVKEFLFYLEVHGLINRGEL